MHVPVYASQRARGLRKPGNRVTYAGTMQGLAKKKLDRGSSSDQQRGQGWSVGKHMMGWLTKGSQPVPR
jgi:hypothetical protein